MQSDIVQRLQPILRRNGWGNVQEYSRHIPFMLEREGLCIVETAEITRLTEALRDAEEREKALREALVATEDAIAEYYRYWTGGEMRGSYDGKPERNGLWQALHKARQALAGAKP